MKSKENSITILLIVIDQLSKFVVGLTNIEIVRNRGVAFSLINGINPIIIALILLVLGRSYRNNFWFGLIIAGGFANLIDRIRLGYVVDFISINIFAVFNLADVFITIGVLGLFYSILKNKNYGNSN